MSISEENAEVVKASAYQKPSEKIQMVLNDSIQLQLANILRLLAHCQFYENADDEVDDRQDAEEKVKLISVPEKGKCGRPTAMAAFVAFFHNSEHPSFQNKKTTLDACIHWINQCLSGRRMMLNLEGTLLLKMLLCIFWHGHTVPHTS